MHSVTEKVTIVIEMITTEDSRLVASLFGKARRSVLAVLYTHPDEAFYLRQLVRASGVGLGPAQRELKGLTASGIISRTVRGKQVYYQANRECPIFEELKSLMESHLEGDLCEYCRDVIETEMGRTFFYLAALCNLLDLNMYDILLKEQKHIKTLGLFNLA